jgi:hypothetical protein
VPPRPDTLNGVALSTVATLEVRPARGARTLRVRAAGARSVELMGDFTHWEPITLTPAGGDTWEVTLPIAAGVHRVNVRIDGGAWLVPRGVPAVPDDLGGVVGLLVVR